MAARKVTPKPSTRSRPTETTLRIIGGRYRGRRIRYNRQSVTRPMKDRVRESVFNLVGPAIVGSHAIDLFAGTGALALEAISRGAKRATALEKHFDMAELVEENARSLGIENLVTVIAGDTFVWAATKPELGHDPWVIFCSPPYDLYRSRPGDIVRLLDGLIQRAPAGSVIVVESDQGFDTGRLPQRDAWTVRDYPPARLAILHVG